MNIKILKKSLSILLLIAVTTLNFSILTVNAQVPSITPEPQMPVSDSTKDFTVIPIAQNPLGLAEGATSNWYSTNWPYSYTNTETLATAIDISETEYIEFDLYISDMELFKAEVPVSFPFFDLIDTNGVKNRYLFGSQITAAGWNHVKINIDDLHENCGMDYSKIIKYQAGTNGGIQSYDYKILNICATKNGLINTLPNPELPSVEDGAENSVIVLSENPLGLTDGQTATSTTTPSYFVKEKTLDKVYDISGAHNIEFDIFISNYNLFLEECSDSWLPFPFFDIKDANTGKKDRYLFRDQITHSGWNHVSLIIGTAYENNGVDYSAVNWIDIGTNAGPQSYSFSVLNICATNLGELPEGWMQGVNGHSDVAYSPAYKLFNMPDTVSLAANLGSNIYRGNFAIQTAKDIEFLDALVYEAARYNIEIMLVLDCISMTDEASTDWMADVQFVAERYNGKNGHGRIRHFQMSNESSRHASAGNWAIEDTAAGYIAEEVEKHSRIFNRCAAIIRAEQEDAILSISSGAKAWYYLKWLKDLGTDFDMMNWIWYEHNDYQIGPVEDTCFKYLDEIGLPYIISEINKYPLLESCKNVDEYNAMLYEHDNDTTFLPSFIKRCERYAKKSENNNLMGIIIYELLDQNRGTQYTDPSQFGAERENRFGIYYTSTSGEIIGEKPVVPYIRNLFGGLLSQPVVPNFTYDNSEPEMPKAAVGKNVIDLSENPMGLKAGEIVYKNLIDYVDWITLDAPVDLSEMDYIEFDIYINDYDFHKKSVNQNEIWGPYFDVKGKTNTGKARFVFGSQITKMGWNHIKIPLSSYTELNGQDFKDIISFEIGANTYVYYAYKVINVCATGMFVPDTTVTHAQLGNADLLFEINKGYESLAKYTVGTSVDLSSGGYITFDIYVSDNNIVQNERNLCMRMFNTSGNELGSLYPLVHMIKRVGWNRVAIPLSHFGNPSAVSKIDFIAFNTPCNTEVRVVNFGVCAEASHINSNNAVLGDINLDGSVDFKDFIRMKKKLAQGAAVFYNNDVNGDGSFNAADIILYRKYILGVCELGI